MAVIRHINIRNNLDLINRTDFSIGTPAQITTKENAIRTALSNMTTSLSDANNFLEYSENNLQLLQDLVDALRSLSHNPIQTEVDAAILAVNSLRNHIETVRNATDSITDPITIPNVYIGTNTTINLRNYFDSSILGNLRLPQPSGGTNKSVRIITASGRSLTRNWIVGVGSNLEIDGDDLKINIPATDLPAGLTRADYPLTVELEFYEDFGTGNAQIQTKNKVKFTIKEPVNSTVILGENFTSTETYREAIEGRLSDFYNANAESIIKEYLLNRINNSGGSLSDLQKSILVDRMYNDTGFLGGNSNNAYPLARLHSFFPEHIKDESVGGDNGYRDALRTLLINPSQFNAKSKEIILNRLENQRNDTTFSINDGKINQEVNNLIQEQALNSIGNITNGTLPDLLAAFANSTNVNVRHQNGHKAGFRGWKKMLGVFKGGKVRRKITDISTNNYFSFFSGKEYDINDNINVAGKSINQNIKLNMNSWNNISAKISVSGDETADFEFAGATSIYELIHGILGHNQVGVITKLYLVFNIYKKLFQNMQDLFGKNDIVVGGNTYNITTQPDIIIRMNGNDLFNENNFKNIENATNLQAQLANLSTHFNAIMQEQNQRYIRGMTTKRQNKFKIGDERVARVLWTRKNVDFNFNIDVEGVSISYENRLFTINYDGEEIKANNLETILSHKILEGKQIQIMKAVYKEMIDKTANDPKAQAWLNKRNGIGFMIEDNGRRYVVSTQGGNLRFGLIPPTFPADHINERDGIITGGMFLSIDENIVLSDPQLASTLIHGLRSYRRTGISA